MVRHGELGGGNGDVDFAAAVEGRADGATDGGDIHAVQPNGGARNKAGTEDLEAGQITSGRRRWIGTGQCGLRNQSVRDATDGAVCGVRGSRNNNFRNMCGLDGSGSGQINDVNGAASGLDDKGLIGDRIDSQTTKKSEGVGSAVLNSKGGHSCPAQLGLASDDGIGLTRSGTGADKGMAP